MAKTLEFFFDFGSPAAYLAHTQLPGLAAQTGATVVYRPMLLGAVFKATGNASPISVPAKGKYTFKDFARFAKRYGVALNHNPHFPIITTTLMRMSAGLLLQGSAQWAAFNDAVFKAIWVDSLNMNDPEVVQQALQAQGFDAAALLALAGEEATKDALKTSTTEAIERGVFGAPTFFVGKDMFWGQDRLDFVREALLVA